MEAEIPENIKKDGRKISEITGQETVSEIVFEDGETLSVSGVFIAMGTAGSADFGRKLGAVDPDGKWIVEENGATMIPGLYAAGDCTGGLLQISKAVSDGALTGLQLPLIFVKTEKIELQRVEKVKIFLHIKTFIFRQIFL